ncbi:Mitochondrial import receptor subunit TOM70 [Stylophora pistillata]|uniref:Mitochondrial import receptor subunit TOM70 n=1 Tax=Stylophora pistillata TaxID=50429 RepID=A0A2B4SHW6_STYPI|nr:Mitochondrial import receptor subunit TOM70 [Stylophora pistillata]
MDCKCKERFRLKLPDIASKLSTENLEKLKFIFEIPQGEAEKISNAEDLFQLLEHELKIAPHRLDFLMNGLDKSGRKDLAAELKNFIADDGRGTSASGSSESSATLGIVEEAEMLNNRGKVEFQEKRYEKACQQYTSALECLPKGSENDKRVKYLCNRAACYVNLRRFHEAYSDCEEALVLDPRHKKARFRLAQALRGKGQISDAYMEITSLKEKFKQDEGIVLLAKALENDIEDAKEKALNKRSEFLWYYRMSDWDPALKCLCEILILMPRIPKLYEELTKIYRYRAECYMGKRNFEDALRDCEEADRLYPGNSNVLFTKMEALDGLRKYKECYDVCNHMLSKGFKEEEARKTIKRLLPKIERESKESKRQDRPELPEATDFSESKRNKSKKSKGTKKKKKKKGQGVANAANVKQVSDTDESNVKCSKPDEFLPRLQDKEEDSKQGDEAIDETFVDTEVTCKKHTSAENLGVKSSQQGNVHAANVVLSCTRAGDEEHDEITESDPLNFKDSRVQLGKEEVSPLKPGAKVLPSVKPTILGSPAGATTTSVNIKSNSNRPNSPCSNNDVLFQTLENKGAIRKSGEEIVDGVFNDYKLLDADRREQISNKSKHHLPVADEEDDENTETLYRSGSSKLDKRREEVSIRKPVVTMLPREKAVLPESSADEAYPRRILLICRRWSVWHCSVCTVNAHLCRGFAKKKDVDVACLVLDATGQEKSAAAKDGVILIKASDQTGIPQGDEHLLFLHNEFPFKAELVVGHGMLSGAAAAIQAKRLNCKRLHVFHNLPVEDDDCHVRLTSEGGKETERDIARKADFVAAIGALLAEQWGMILNRGISVIIPGLPDVAPRNKIPTPQSRCLILGTLLGNDNFSMNGLGMVIDALKDCRQGSYPIHVTVLGTERGKIEELKDTLKTRCCTSSLEVAVKPFEVSLETIGVEIRGVSLVLIPFLSDGFGVLALEAISAGVPVLITSSSGLAKCIQQEFDERFLKFVCATERTTLGDRTEDWSDAIEEIVNDREKAFSLAASLREQWNSKFTWESICSKLLLDLGKFGDFLVRSPSSTQPIGLPSQCTDSARRLIEVEVDLLNRRRKHVLFLSPENASKSPFIQYFAQVPWAAVFDFDVRSVESGYLASCENFCERMGMKICRILPPLPDEERKKVSVMLPNGIPWVLLDGMPESKRNIKDNLEWMREFFLSLMKTYPGPITFVVLWYSGKRILSKNLSKILTVVQGSPLHGQVKLVIVSSASGEDELLEDIAEDWGVEVHKFDLEEVTNALCQCISACPFIREDQDFSLPVADQSESHRLAFKILPQKRRWINAEMEVLYQSCGSTPEFDDDALHFYRGGQISWYALQMGYAVERENWEALHGRIDELILKAGTMKLKLPHQRGAGGTTTARKILFDYHERYPCVLLRSVSHSEIAPAIKVLSEFCKLPVIILVDCKHIQTDEFDVDSLYNNLSNDRIPCVILEVIHSSQHRDRNTSEWFQKSEKTSPVLVADTLEQVEATAFVRIYSAQKKGKERALRSLLNDSGKKELQIPFYYALVTFEDRFTALEPFVKECLQNLSKNERHILLFLAMAYHYGHCSIFANDFAELLNAPMREVLSLESVLPELSQELLLEEDGKWRPRHDLIAAEMLRHLLTMPDDERCPLTHPDNWRNQLADKAIICFNHMSEAVVSDMLLNRVTDENSHNYFSQLISDIPCDEDAIRLFETAISLFPHNPFFKVHLGRYYSIQKKSAGFQLAIKYTDKGISLTEDFSSRFVRGQFAQMKGVVYSREVHNLASNNANIETIIEMADEGVKNFRRAVSIAPDLVDGYIPEVRMMCKVFEYIEKKTGSFLSYVKSGVAHPFIIDAISNTSDTLESVPDSDAYSYWRMRLACIGRHSFNGERMKETLNLLLKLRKNDRASRGSINRQIVIMWMEIQSRQRRPIAEIAPRSIELLNEALKYDSNIEKTMRLWVKLASFTHVDLTESESKIFHWCLKEKSVRSYLYKYIVACLRLLEGNSHSYSEIMRNAKDDLNSAIKAINRSDVGRCRHPDRPVVWLGHEGRGMGNLVYLDEKIPELSNVRMKRSIASQHTKQLRSLSGLIVECGNKVGTIRINEDLDVPFRADLCETPLMGSGFLNRKVQLYLAFNFFGADAYNVQLANANAEEEDLDWY